MLFRSQTSVVCCRWSSGKAIYSPMFLHSIPVMHWVVRDTLNDQRVQSTLIPLIRGHSALWLRENSNVGPRSSHLDVFNIGTPLKMVL